MGCKVWDPVRGILGLQGGGLAGCRPRGVAQRVFERVSKASASLNRQQSQRMAARLLEGRRATGRGEARGPGSDDGDRVERDRATSLTRLLISFDRCSGLEDDNDLGACSNSFRLRFAGLDASGIRTWLFCEAERFKPKNMQNTFLFFHIFGSFLPQARFPQAPESESPAQKPANKMQKVCKRKTT